MAIFNSVNFVFPDFVLESAFGIGADGAGARAWRWFADLLADCFGGRVVWG